MGKFGRKTVVLKARNPINLAQANEVSAVWGSYRLTGICVSKIRHYGYVSVVACPRHAPQGGRSPAPPYCGLTAL
ncbi:MAG: hypothetical protein IJU33_09735 [Bacteroidales bacterium]|nr:hypothetical protein [Bacteroidales bacterium]